MLVGAKNSEWSDCGEDFVVVRGVKCAAVYHVVRQEPEAHPVTQDTGVEQFPQQEWILSFSSTR